MGMSEIQKQNKNNILTWVIICCWWYWMLYILFYYFFFVELNGKNKSQKWKIISRKIGFLFSYSYFDYWLLTRGAGAVIFVHYFSFLMCFIIDALLINHAIIDGFEQRKEIMMIFFLLVAWLGRKDMRLWIFDFLE